MWWVEIFPSTLKPPQGEGGRRGTGEVFPQVWRFLTPIGRKRTWAGVEVEIRKWFYWGQGSWNALGSWNSFLKQLQVGADHSPASSDGGSLVAKSPMRTQATATTRQKRTIKAISKLLNFLCPICGRKPERESKKNHFRWAKSAGKGKLFQAPGRLPAELWGQSFLIPDPEGIPGMTSSSSSSTPQGCFSSSEAEIAKIQGFLALIMGFFYMVMEFTWIPLIQLIWPSFNVM